MTSRTSTICPSIVPTYITAVAIPLSHASRDGGTPPPGPLLQLRQALRPWTPVPAPLLLRGGRLFYLEVGDYTSDGEDDASTGEASATPAEGMDPVVSLHVVADIRAEDTMMVTVYIHRHRQMTLLDSSSNARCTI